MESWVRAVVAGGVYPFIRASTEGMPPAREIHLHQELRALDLSSCFVTQHQWG